MRPKEIIVADQVIDDFGQRDTFAFEERTFLSRFARIALSEDPNLARGIVESRKSTIWVRQTADRQSVWTLAQRTLDLMLRQSCNSSRKILQGVPGRSRGNRTFDTD